MSNVSIKREAILRFWCAMNNLDYDVVVDEYLGKTNDPNWTNKLHQATEMAVHYMESSSEDTTRESE